MNNLQITGSFQEKMDSVHCCKQKVREWLLNQIFRVIDVEKQSMSHVVRVEICITPCQA